MNYDAIIIGSGLGGLSCGAYLAKNGWKVLVLEKHSKSGGYATSFKRGDFTFDAGLHMMDGVGKGQNFYKPLEWCGVADKIEFLKLKYFEGSFCQTTTYDSPAEIWKESYPFWKKITPMKERVSEVFSKR